VELFVHTWGSIEKINAALIPTPLYNGINIPATQFFNKKKRILGPSQ